jgi:hypothetical protein
MAETVGQPPFTREQVRQLLSECVTVVKPGETLVVRADQDWTPNQVREVQDWLDCWHFDGNLPFRVIVLPGEEFAVMKAETAP